MGDNKKTGNSKETKNNKKETPKKVDSVARKLVLVTTTLLSMLGNAYTGHKLIQSDVKEESRNELLDDLKKKRPSELSRANTLEDAVITLDSLYTFTPHKNN